MVVILKGRDEDVPEGSWRDEYFLKDPHWHLASNIEFTSSTYDSIGASFLKRCIFFRRDFLYAKSLVCFLGEFPHTCKLYSIANPLPELPTNLGNRNQIANIIESSMIVESRVPPPPKKKTNLVMYCEAGVKQWSATLLRPTPKGWNRVHWGNDFWGLKD